MHPHNVPDELQERPQWICWKEEIRNGKPTKVPKQPDGSGANAKSNDMATWGTFDQAVETAKARGWGIGFVFSDADPYLGIDLDDCLRDDSMREWLASIGTGVFVDTAYIERSPSGEGIHILLKDCDIPDWWTNVDRECEGRHEEVAVFDSGRFFTVTGEANQAGAETIGTVDLQAWLKDAWREFEDGLPWDDGPDRDADRDDVDIDVHDVLLSTNYPEQERVEHPVHGSDTGSNFMVDDGAETWRCWRHGCTGNALHLIGMQEGIIDCGQWDRSGVSSDEWAAIFEAAREQGFDVGDETGQRPTSAAAETAQTQGQTDGGGATATASGGDVPAAQTLEDRVREDVLTPLDPPEEYHGEEITLEVAINRFADLLCDEYAFVRPRRDVRGWRDTLYVYDGESGIYEPHGESWIAHETERLLGAVANNQRVNEVVQKVERRSYAEPGELTSDPHRLVVANGILNLHTGEVGDHTPEEYHRTRLDIAYDPDAECERINQFFHEVVADSDVRTLYQLVAHCLYKEYLEEKAAMLLGDGQNGKSVFLALLEEFLGEYNVARRSLQDLGENDFAANNLEGKLANLHPDMASETVNELDTFKQLTGRDTMVADVKYERPIHFENHATLIFAANRMPKMGEDTHALWRRWIYVNFPYTFDPTDPEAKDPTPKRQLMAELTAEEELQGLLVRAVEELNRWYEEHVLFTDAAAPEQVREKMKRASEPVYDFAKTCLEPTDNDDDFVLKEDVRECYRKFAREEDLPTIADNQFGERLLNLRDLPVENTQRRVDNRRAYVYTGVKFSSRGRQVLGLDDDNENEGLDETTGRWRTVVDVVCDLERDTEGVPSKAKIMGRLSAHMNLRNAKAAFEDARSKGEIYSPPGEDGWGVTD